MDAIFPWGSTFWDGPTNIFNISWMLWTICVVAAVFITGIIWLAEHGNQRNARRLLLTAILGVTGSMGLWLLYIPLGIAGGAAFLFRDAFPDFKFSGLKEHRELKAAARRIAIAQKIAQMEREAGIEPW